MKDPGFVADVMASTNELAKALLCRVVEMPEVCEHDWHCAVTVNGRQECYCQKCGEARR